MDAVLAAGTLADRQGIAADAAGLVDQGRGGGPAGIVEGGLVQRLEAALERIVQVHAVCPFRRLSAVRRRARVPQVRSRNLPPGVRSAVRLPALRALIARFPQVSTGARPKGMRFRNQVGTRAFRDQVHFPMPVIGKLYRPPPCVLLFPFLLDRSPAWETKMPVRTKSMPGMYRAEKGRDTIAGP